jgi:hypothetical protein
VAVLGFDHILLVLQWIWRLTVVRQTIALRLRVMLVMPALTLVAWGRRTMHGASTNIRPLMPPSLYYVRFLSVHSQSSLPAITLVYLGLTMLINSWWGAVLIVPVLLIFHWEVVRHEERYLELKVGDLYAEYRSSSKIV